MNKKNCFVIAPLGEEHSGVRRKVETIIKDILQPALGEQYHVFSAHQIKESGLISMQIVETIFKADLIICDLTSVNGNVMYELAIAHLQNKPVIIIAERQTAVPFDINHQRIIFYDDNISGSFFLKKAIEEAIVKTPEGSLVDNPITAYLNRTKTSLVREDAILNTIKETIFEVTKSNAGSGEDIITHVEKQLNQPKTDNRIIEYLANENRFDRDKFYQEVCSTIENNGFPVPVDKLIKDYTAGNERQRYLFDYLIESGETLYLIKIANTISRISILPEGHIIADFFNSIEKIGEFSKDKIQIIIIIPSLMERSGKLVGKKIPLLKFDTNTKFSNWSIVKEQFDKLHTEELVGQA
jgi:hypothetical protein